MYSLWFIKDMELLDENSRIDNYFDLSEEIERFRITIESIKLSSTVWLIWRFWSWKSNFLNQVQSTSSTDVKWLSFDAWKYPERNNLWENFTLELAMQLWSWKDITKIIEWTQHEDKKVILSIATKLPWEWIKWLPWFESLKEWIDYFLKSSPAKRTYEIQEILRWIFESIIEQEIYIIIEDIDRSWDKWIYFLETLNYFLKNSGIQKKIIAIIPIWTENYNEPNQKYSFSKCLDYEHYISLHWLNFDNFVEKLFIDEISTDWNLKWQLSTFFQWVYYQYNDQITLRLIKSIIRNANINYVNINRKYWDITDFRFSIIFAFLKNIMVNWSNINHYRLWTETIQLNGTDIFSLFIWVVIWKKSESPWRIANLNKLINADWGLLKINEDLHLRTFPIHFSKEPDPNYYVKSFSMEIEKVKICFDYLI